MMTLSERMLEFKGGITTRMAPEQVLRLRADVSNLADDVRLLEAENARLRGMLEEAWDCIKFGAACAGCSSWWRHGKLCKLMGFLRDIGIEVDPDVGRYGY